MSKMVNSLKHNNAPMDETREMIAVWIDTKKTVAAVIRNSKNLKERLQQVDEEVEQEV